MKKKVGMVYMCGTDWNHELFETPNGPEIYKSVKALKKDRICWKECGIVKIQLNAKFIKQVKKGSL